MRKLIHITVHVLFVLISLLMFSSSINLQNIHWFLSDDTGYFFFTFFIQPLVVFAGLMFFFSLPLAFIWWCFFDDRILEKSVLPYVIINLTHLSMFIGRLGDARRAGRPLTSGHIEHTIMYDELFWHGRSWDRLQWQANFLERYPWFDFEKTSMFDYLSVFGLFTLAEQIEILLYFAPILLHLAAIALGVLIIRWNMRNLKNKILL